MLRALQRQRSTQGMAVVRFKTPEEAHRAVRSKQWGIVVNSPVRLRVLQ